MDLSLELSVTWLFLWDGDELVEITPAPNPYGSEIVWRIAGSGSHVYSHVGGGFYERQT